MLTPGLTSLPFPRAPGLLRNLSQTLLIQGRPTCWPSAPSFLDPSLGLGWYLAQPGHPQGTIRAPPAHNQATTQEEWVAVASCSYQRMHPTLQCFWDTYLNT